MSRSRKPVSTTNPPLDPLARIEVENQRVGVLDVFYREGFRMAAGRERSIRYRAGGPASESLRRTNPWEGGERLAVYGDLSK
jgi:hypothetical protein